MRVLHVVKTADGGRWAAWQAGELARRGVEIHVALPSAEGSAVPDWRESGARLHTVEVNFPARSPWRLPALCREFRHLVVSIQPDLIHSHTVGSTLLMRYALGKRSPIPRIFQVPGPLHLEHGFFRRWELATAGESDYWIASSRCTQRIYQGAGIPREKLFLSYYGVRVEGFSAQRSGVLRKRLGIADDAVVVGNINYMYAPKYYLGQTVGLKCHEDVIQALGIVLRERSDVVGVLGGGAWGKASGYEKRLRRLAERLGRGRILMPGHLPLDVVKDAWADFDCAVHVPLSENCGGVVEPLLAEVPTIAGNVGGLPDVVMDGVNGKVVPIRKPDILARAILEVLRERERHRHLARVGAHLVRTMFDVRRTAAEVFGIYRHILEAEERPDEFLAERFLRSEALAT